MSNISTPKISSASLSLDEQEFDNPLKGNTPCKENPDFFSSPLLDVFDSQEFKESNPELEGPELDKALDMAERSHQILHVNAVAEAVKICRGCPALAACAEWVTGFESNHSAVYGVVAGMEPHQRRKFRRREERRAAAEIAAK